MNIVKIIIYFFYMIYMSLKSIKLWIVKKTKGEKAGVDYCGKVAKDWSRFTVKIIGLNITIKGKENIPKEPCCYMGNHTSILDIPVLIDSVDKCMGFIAKKEMINAPFLGFWINRYKCVPLDRENAREAIKSIKKGSDNIKEGYSMAIFPEGTRSQDGKLKDFKKGSLKLATMAKAPIVPVTIDGAYRAFEKGKKFRAIDLTITFSEPFYTENLNREEEKALMEKVRAVIAKNLGQ
ncbi:lysophospholipid acyltransferase family protein [Clostridium sp.]|uniref:lysophospholipid acyltransferase family protein n=1 Tax=Clostridium sp. TaxID=1506 RepID=UPI0026361F83|nr:lysophospholipid acyltransferase family protein [Clostridium sp.]